MTSQSVDNAPIIDITLTEDENLLPLNNNAQNTSINNSNSSIHKFMQTVGASKRIFDLLDHQPKILSTSNESCSIEPTNFDESIHFDNVSFAYPTRSEQQILTNVSFSIALGQKLALVGPSGSGKSTIASLIERFYEFDSGTIYLGSYSLASINSQWLRQNISFVNQEPSLFACSICDNITFGLD
ncbi:unnamed protein product [Rotaria sp. Silwood1]|nr:unnamed protein product [Rotaria sp. Silwood1]